MMNNMKDEKKAMRAAWRAKREAVSPEDKAAWDARICDVITSCASYRYAEVILAYAAFGFEIDVNPVIDRALRDGKRVALPRTYGRGEMTFRYITDRGALEEGMYGILCPSDSCPAYEGAPATLCLVPGIVFDKHGLRIGYGGGYYDRFLRASEVTPLGVIYRSFVLPTLPGGHYDHFVTALATERGILPIQPTR